MRAYSIDFREHIVAAIDRGELSLRSIAHIFSVSLSFIVRLLQHRRRTGSVQPKPHVGGPIPKLDAAAVQRLLAIVQHKPDATLAELRDELGITCHIATIARVLHEHHITRKKKTLHAQERDRPEVQAQRTAFAQDLAAVEPEHLIFIDETGTTTAMARMYGRAPEGERVPATVPGQWENITLIAGLRPTGVVAPLAFLGATDAAAMATYVPKVLVPELQPGDVVVWDNLQPHKNAEVIKAIEAAGARVKPLPVYSPDMTPIEEMFSKIKEYLRSVGARTRDAVMDAMGEALKQITPDDICGWFQDRCAYAVR